MKRCCIRKEITQMENPSQMGELQGALLTPRLVDIRPKARSLERNIGPVGSVA
jgi:hypothetical protein